MTPAVTMGEELRRYLESIATDQGLLIDNFENMRPYFVFADSGRYGRIVHPEGRSVQYAIATATGTGVSRVVGLPIEDPRLARQYVDANAPCLLTVLKDRYYDPLVAALGRRMEELWVRLSHSEFGERLRTSLPEELRHTIWNSIHPPLYYYLGFTVAGNRILTAQLEPLVKMLPAVVPLRRHKTEDGTWFVVCM